MEEKNADIAKKIAAAYRSISKDLDITAAYFNQWGEIYTKFRSWKEAIHSYEKALLLDPENKEAKDKIKALKEKK